ncbi:MAG: pyruvate dehydrogenase (acetyl-transferring), homodimeric type [Planctomycetes bacterium]|nr:pyruvate dehydrogenase (acetyl-transferring), homodimeric type [Planctomycetota bacterium]
MSTYVGHSSDDPAALAQQTHDWLDSLEDVLASRGPDFVRQLLRNLQIHAQKQGVVLPVTSQTPYLNTIPTHRQPPYPGNLEIERRIKSIIRWNAMAMVVRANRDPAAPGGHISTYASIATLYEVGYNHFFRGRKHACGGDSVYFQGHASPGNYARAFTEGRLSESHLKNFRRELRDGIGAGLSSYPHPWLMPDFWEYPTVSMGLGPLMSIYRARFMRYLDDRGIKEYKGAKVWNFGGDGEVDEPETLGAITLASREKLDNLIWVINCNLQRLDGPVRGNGKIIQELEAIFRGAGWNVIKVLWGGDWDPLFEQDDEGLLVHRLEEMVDGEYQKLRVEGGAYIRENVFGAHEKLQQMVANMSDDQLWHLRLGGHDPRKVHAAYKTAFEHEGAPTVILAKTIKGYGLGEAGEGMNITHQQKKMNEAEMLAFRDRFNIPLTNEQVKDLPFYRPADNSIEMQYIRERQAALGGPVPSRTVVTNNWEAPDDSAFTQFDQGTGDKDMATTMAFVRVLQKLLRDKQIGKYIVPIIPDEARTFGMDGLFPMVGIYSHVGQLYEPVDRDTIAYYKETTDGQILEEGINEAGSMCSFIAAGTSHTSHAQPMIPFYIYYSMFGFQRIGDLVWLAGDIRSRGFMLGGTAGRTTLNGEGLQHQDGHSHLLFSVVPNIRAYDPAYGYEIAVILRDGIRRMYYENEDIFYYLAVGNEPYAHPAKPEGCEEGILKGAYKLKPAPKKAKLRAQLLGSASIINSVLEAQQMLADKYDVAADVWSVTSYTELRREALDVERWNLLHPESEARVPYVTQCFGKVEGPIIAASDYMKALPDLVAKWVPGGIVSLGTDGFGRSESRQALRDHFEVDARYVVLAALKSLADRGEYDKSRLSAVVKELGINPDKPNPLKA